MSAKFDAAKLVDFLKTELDTTDLKKKLKGLAKLDWNPFDKDGDEYKTAWAEVKNNIRIVKQAVAAIVVTAEKGAGVLKILDGGTKLESVAQFLYSLITLPWFLRWAKPAIKPLVKFAVSAIVDLINTKLGHNWPTDAADKA